MSMNGRSTPPVKFESFGSVKIADQALQISPVLNNDLIGIRLLAGNGNEYPFFCSAGMLRDMHKHSQGLYSHISTY